MALSPILLWLHTLLSYLHMKTSLIKGYVLRKLGKLNFTQAVIKIISVCNSKDLCDTNTGNLVNYIFTWLSLYHLLYLVYPWQVELFWLGIDKHHILQFLFYIYSSMYLKIYFSSTSHMLLGSGTIEQVTVHMMASHLCVTVNFHSGWKSISVNHSYTWISRII